MPDSRPTVPDLLAVVRNYLERELLPSTDSYHQFQLRIAAKLLGTIGNEFALGEQARQAETERLAALLGDRASYDAMNTELARRIRAGELPVASPALLAHLRQTTEDALTINNPGWIVREAPAAER